MVSLSESNSVDLAIDGHEHTIERVEKREHPDLDFDTIIEECIDDDCPYQHVYKRENRQTTIGQAVAEGSR